jgi:3-hydroxyisobutyrate dehydrogenase
MKEIGFIGLGIMGSAMASRLVQAHPVTVYNRTASRSAALVAAGARQASTPAECARGKEIVISIVTDSADVEEVLAGPWGAIHGAERDALFVDMSTISPETARGIGAALHDRGVAFLDAPVTGGDVGARSGTLSILVGGERSDLERANDVFAVLGKRVTHCGPLGSGQVMKACNQILCAVNMVGICEALLLAHRSGLDQALLVEALKAGAGGSWALEHLGGRIARGDFAPGFMVDLLCKDLRIVDGMAERLDLPLRAQELARELFGLTQKLGGGRLGTQAVYATLERAAGLNPAARDVVPSTS